MVVQFSEVFHGYNEGNSNAVDSNASQVKTIELKMPNIFNYLYAFVDEEECSDIRNNVRNITSIALAPPSAVNGSLAKQLKSSFTKDEDECIFDNEMLGQSVESGKIYQKVFSTIGHFFLGYDNRDSTNFFFSYASIFYKQIEEGMNLLSSSGGSASRLHQVFKQVFVDASTLRVEREKFACRDRKQRMVLWATVAMTVCGKCFESTAIFYVGVVAASVTLIYKLNHYIRKSDELNQLSNQLRTNVGTAERIFKEML